MFFDSWQNIFRVLVMGTASYVALIVFLRLSGKRTLSKMNMFDFIITVSLGSAFATVTLSKDTALADGLTALALLIALQYGVAWLSVRSKRFQELVKGEPALLFYRGHYLRKTMMTERISPEEVRFAARSQGVDDMSTLGAVILETDGTFSVVPTFEGRAGNALEDVQLPAAIQEHPGGSRQ